MASSAAYALSSSSTHSGDSTSSSGIESSSSSSECSVMSLLDRLRSATPAEISRKRKLKTNPPPVGKRRSRGTFLSDPKRLEPNTRIKDFPNEKLKVFAGKIFYSACHERTST